MADDFIWNSACETRDMILAGDVTPGEVVEAALAQIDRLEPALHAFVTVDPQGARVAAAQAARALSEGEATGPLFGVPVAIKDDMWVKDLPATAGSLLFARFRPTIDGSVAERLRAAGAIIVGKTNLPEFAAWPRTKSFLAGETPNPWDTGRISGASSGGSAAAVASAMVSVAIGTDGGGSTRIPASLCGLVGLYSTLGRVPSYGGFHCSPAESAGPLARSVRDAAVVQQVIAGPDPRVKNAIKTPAPNLLEHLEAGVQGLPIAWSANFGRISVVPAVLDCTLEALAALKDSGAVVREIGDRIDHPWGDATFADSTHEAVAAVGSIGCPELPPPDIQGAQEWLAASSADGELMMAMPQFRALMAENLELLTPPFRVNRMSGMPQIAGLKNVIDAILGNHAVLCSPTMADVARLAPPGFASAYPNSYMGTDFTFIANTCGYPAATVPCGLVDGLPVGFQIIGRWGDEPTVLRVARALEKALPAMPRPPLALKRA